MTSRNIVAICTVFAVLCSVSSQRLPRPVAISVQMRTKDTVILEWKNPPAIRYAQFKLQLTPDALIQYPVEKDHTFVTIGNMKPGVTYRVSLRGMTSQLRLSTPTTFNLWSEPPAPSDLYVSTLGGVKLTVSLGPDTQDFTAKVTGAQVEWDPADVDNPLLGYDVQLFPQEGTVVYPDDNFLTDSVRLFTGLTPGREYSVSVRTKIGPPYALVYSEPISDTFVIPPVSPYDVKTNAVGSTYATLSTLSVFGESDGMYFDLRPEGGEVGDAFPDPVLNAYDLYSIRKLQPMTDYACDVYTTSHGVRSLLPSTVYFTTKPSGRVTMTVQNFTSTSVTFELFVQRKAEEFTFEEEKTDEYVIRYTNIGDPESYQETKAIKHTGGEDTTFYIRVHHLQPGVTYHFTAVKSPSTLFAQPVSDVIQTTIPHKPRLMSLEAMTQGVGVAFEAPVEGECPFVKVHFSPGRDNYLSSPTMHKTGEMIFLIEVPWKERYTIHSRCVSSGVEGSELVTSSLNTTDALGNRMHDDQSPRMQLKCKIIKNILTNTTEESTSGRSGRITTTANPMPPPSPRKNPDACCGLRPYESESESCCGGALIQHNAVPQKLCCGTVPYVAAHKICCDGWNLVPKSEGCDSSFKR